MTSSNQKYLVLDYESRSEADIKAVGAYEYSIHPSTEILCAAWAFGTKEELKTAKIDSWSFKQPFRNPVFISALKDPSVAVVAHNAYFENVITMHKLKINVPIDRWICTAARAAALALPRDLEGACAALRLRHQKDTEGRKLMMKMCKPRRETKNNKDKWHEDPADILRLIQYCEQDVRAEVDLFLHTPSLHPTEKKVWALDQKINLRGVRVDADLIVETLNKIETETTNLNIETQILTDFKIDSVNQIAEVLKFIESKGEFLPDLTAGTVREALASDTIKTPESRRLLEIRQSISKTSTAKYEAFKKRSTSDGRIRDNLLYHGASTGRWSGRGVQLQNTPRGTVKNTDLSCEVVKNEDIEMVRLLYGNPMDVFSSNIRGAIIPSRGKELFCADYAAIETRVLFWLSDHARGVQAYREGRDLYREMAAAIYRTDLSSVTKDQRQVGKKIILGCGYGLGGKKFYESCLGDGIPIDQSTSEIAVKTYRETHYPVPAMWTQIEQLAVAATRNVGKKYVGCQTKWWVECGFLWCELPSGRRLAFSQPEIRMKPTPWGEQKPTLYHWSQNSLTKKWECAGTYGGKLVENVVQAVARDFMADAMLRIESAGYDILFSVHDELVAERTIGEGNLAEFEKLMETLPATWGKGAPIKVEGWTSKNRYKK